MSRIQLLLVTAAAGAAVASPAHTQEKIWEHEGESGVFFGVDVSMAPDIDGDGLDDVLVGDYQFSGGSGGAFVYSGRTGELVRSWVGQPGLNGLGRALAGLGDVDGDDVGDVAVSAFWEDGLPGIYVGRTYVYSGRTGKEIWSRLGEADQDYFGWNLCSLGDSSGDDVRELAVTAGFHDGPAGLDTGRVYVLDGATGEVRWSVAGEAAGDLFGEALSSAGDVDRDGIEELVVGAPRHDERRGKVYVFSGATGGLLYSVEGRSAGDEFGWAVAGVADLRHGRPSNVLVGSPGYDGDAGEDSGRVVLLSGADGRVLGSLEGTAAAIRFGRAVAPAGDVNRDRTQDFLIGAGPFGFTMAPGEAWLVSGSSFGLLWRWEGSHGGDQFGSSLDGGSDLDGDGLPDVVIGAYQNIGSSGGGRVATFQGNDLFLEATPGEVAGGDTLRLQVRGGPRRARAALYVVEIGGAPVHIPITRGRLDQNGESVFEVVVPPGLAGLDVRFQSLAQRGQRVVDSNTTLVHFR